MLADNYFKLQGRVALVTGASSGLGEQFARSLCAAGCRVVGMARRAQRLQTLADELADAGAEFLPLAVDVTDAAACEAALATSAQRWGPISILVNNAGTGQVSEFLNESVADADRVFDVNLRAAWRLGQLVSQQMIATQTPGSIINIASILGLGLQKQTGSYAVSKAALIQLTRLMALELAEHRIRVNAIAPGYVLSEMTQAYLHSDAYQRAVKRVPQRRYANADELEGLLLLLASERSSYMTGSVIPVDGGHLLASL